MKAKTGSFEKSEMYEIIWNDCKEQYNEQSWIAIGTGYSVHLAYTKDGRSEKSSRIHNALNSGYSPNKNSSESDMRQRGGYWTLWKLEIANSDNLSNNGKGPNTLQLFYSFFK